MNQENGLSYCMDARSQGLSRLFEQKKSGLLAALYEHLDFQIIDKLFGFCQPGVGFHAISLDGLDDFALTF